MRNKLLSNTSINSISKGGVLYRAGELPVLTKEQTNQANLVKKLPADFPIADWENMNAKAQLKAMQRSGLSDKEQWALLNTTAPLSALSQHNQAQDAIDTRATATRIATTLMSAAAKAAIPRTQVTANKPTNLTPLQSEVLNGKLEKTKDALATSFKSVASSKDAFEQKSSTLSAKIGGRMSATTRSSNQTPSLAPTPTPTPNPSQTPLPEPGPSPEISSSE